MCCWGYYSKGVCVCGKSHAVYVCMCACAKFNKRCHKLELMPKACTCPRNVWFGKVKETNSQNTASPPPSPTMCMQVCAPSRKSKLKTQKANGKRRNRRMSSMLREGEERQVMVQPSTKEDGEKRGRRARR